MTDKKSRKVLIINNIKSDTIDQAIFILKGDLKSQNSSHLDTNIAGEAQEIIDRYIRQVERIKYGTAYKNHSQTKKAKKSLPWPLFFFITSILSAVLSIALIYGAG